MGRDHPQMPPRLSTQGPIECSGMLIECCRNADRVAGILIECRRNVDRMPAERRSNHSGKRSMRSLLTHLPNAAS
jgi:hypothetical protein